jgi:hypothetical protein
MAEIIHFEPQSTIDHRSNLANFIQFAKLKLTAFDQVEGWESDRWQNGTTKALFAQQSFEKNSYSYAPMRDPFRQFAKAYIRYNYSHCPSVSVTYHLQALRCVEAALLSVHGEADIVHLNFITMDKAADFCREFYRSEDVHHKTGLKMGAIFEFCLKKQIIAETIAWRSPFKKPRILTEGLSSESTNFRNSKLPSNQSMLMLADLFANAKDLESKYFTSILILLMVTPSRISEVLALPVNCIGWQKDVAGKPQMFLRWQAAKGKGAMKKWIIPAMQSVVEEAVARLTEISAPARRAALFAFENPGQFLPSSDSALSQEVGNDQPLSVGQFFAALDLAPTKQAKRFWDSTDFREIVMPQKWFVQLMASGPPTYRSLSRFVKDYYSNHCWPLLDQRQPTKVWEALCLHREFEFHPEFKTKSFSWRVPRSSEVNVRLQDTKGLSFFERAGLKNVDGSSIKLTTHQIRHWLSTMSERAGMDDYTLAQWAGRANVKDNRHYDHRSPEERLQAVRHLVVDEVKSPLQRYIGKLPVTYQELGIDRLGTAKATLYGMCTHDFAMTPCMKQRECMTCKEHVCIEGDHITLDRIKVLEAQTLELLAKAKEAHEEGVFGADRWIDNHKAKLVHVQAIRLTLEHPQVPNGALVRIPTSHDPSPAQRYLIDIGAIPPVDFGKEAPTTVTKFVTDGSDA